MPMDGFTLSAVTSELSETLIDGRVDKITQPEPDEIILSIRSQGVNRKLLLTANANAPRIHYTTQSKTAPLQAPMFTMVLRKHLSGGRLILICQPDFERIVEMHFESRNEMGDKSIKRLIIEIMGKHSNIILIDENDTILEAAKHVSFNTSSVREVLPGRAYMRPPSGGKVSPLTAKKETFVQLLKSEDKQTAKLQQALYQNYNGISPILASEICQRANLAPETILATLTDTAMETLFNAFTQVQTQPFSYRLYFDTDNKAVDFSVFPFTIYRHYHAKEKETASETLESFYIERDNSYRLKQKTTDLRKLVNGHMERCRKKQIVYEKTLTDIADRDRLKLYGELITAYVYAIEKSADIFSTPNFYNENEIIEIPLDPMLTPSENAQAYFKQYNKQKRTYAALQDQINQNENELSYFDSVTNAIQTAADEADIAEIRSELAEQGIIKAKYKKQAHRMQKKSKPLHYTSSDGLDMYVGKNNNQNDELTLRFAHNHDIWMHTKDIAGSHVIIRTNGETPPDNTLREGANLAAYYSKARESSQVPVDYAIKKHVRKPVGAKPGFVIYDHHKTMYITPVEPGHQME